VRRPLWRATIVVIVGGLGVLLVALWLGSDSTSETDERLDARLTQLRTAAPEPSPPPGADRVSRNEFKGDLASDPAEIVWSYSFKGPLAQVVEHYRTTMPNLGWQELPPHPNVYGIVAQFQKPATGGPVFLTVFMSSESESTFRLEAASS